MVQCSFKCTINISCHVSCHLLENFPSLRCHYYDSMDYCSAVVYLFLHSSMMCCHYYTRLVDLPSDPCMCLSHYTWSFPLLPSSSFPFSYICKCKHVDLMLCPVCQFYATPAVAKQYASDESTLSCGWSVCWMEGRSDVSQSMACRESLLL